MHARVPVRLRHKRSQPEMLDIRILTSFPPLPEEPKIEEESKNEERNEDTTFDYKDVLREASAWKGEVGGDTSVRTVIGETARRGEEEGSDDNDEFKDVIKTLRRIAGQDLKVRQSIADFRRVTKVEVSGGKNEPNWWFGWKTLLSK